MESLIEKASNILKKLGVDGYDIFGVEGRGNTIEVKKGEVEKVKVSSSQGIAIRVLTNGQMGFAYTNDVSEDGIRIAIECAKENSKVSEPDDYTFSSPQENFFDVILEDPEFEKIPTERKISLALELEERAKSYDSRVDKIRKASYSDGRRTVYYLNSKGHSFKYTTTSYSLSIFLTARKGEEAQSGWDYQSARFFNELNPSEVASGAVISAVELLGAKPLKTMKVPVIFKNTVFAEIIETLSSAFLGHNVLRGKSLFKDKLEREVASRSLTIYDDPFQKEGLGSYPFDDEGTTTRKKPIIERGVLKNFLLDLYTARKLKMEPTGNGIRASVGSPPTCGITNLVVERGALRLEEMIKTPKEVILITEAMGIHTINPISGEFSIGINGIYFNDGEKVAPVSKMTVAGNVKELLKGITEVGADVKWIGNVCSPSVLVKELTVSGE